LKPLSSTPFLYARPFLMVILVSVLKSWGRRRPALVVKIFSRQVSSRDFGALRGVDASHSEKRWRDINMTGKRGSPVDPLHRDRLLEGQMNAFLVRKRKRPLAAQPMGRWRVDWTHQFYSTFQRR
jgi:hypothetical protein